jgi:hypothetical protein
MGIAMLLFDRCVRFAMHGAPLPLDYLAYLDLLLCRASGSWQRLRTQTFRLWWGPMQPQPRPQVGSPRPPPSSPPPTIVSTGTLRPGARPPTATAVSARGRADLCCAVPCSALWAGAYDETLVRLCGLSAVEHTNYLAYHGNPADRVYSVSHLTPAPTVALTAIPPLIGFAVCCDSESAWHTLSTIGDVSGPHFRPECRSVFVPPTPYLPLP